MNETIEYKRQRACHPGEFVQEIIEDMGVTQEEFAFRMGVSGKCVSELINGKCRMTPELAGKLSAMLGMEAEIWLNLQALYDSKLLEIKAAMELDRQRTILSCLDFGYFLRMTDHGPIRDTRKRISFLCELLGISSLEQLRREVPGGSFSLATGFMNESHRICARAWLHLAWRKASEMESVQPFKADTLQASLTELRSLTRLGVIAALPRLTVLLQACGIAFVPLPSLRNAHVNGAVKWFSGNQKALLTINDHMKTEDAFWLTLFHEVRHVLQRKFRQSLVCLADASAPDAELERDADSFAQELLLPSALYDAFVLAGDFSLGSLRRLADQANLHPGIVAARLARDGHLSPRTATRLQTPFTLPSPPTTLTTP